MEDEYFLSRKIVYDDARLVKYEMSQIACNCRSRRSRS